MHADDASPTPNRIPECNLSKQELIDEIARLQQELSKYTSREKRGARDIDDKAFRALTGFYNAVEAEREYGLSGGDAVYGALHRHGTVIDTSSMSSAYSRVSEQFPGLESLIDNAMSSMSSQHRAPDGVKSNCGAPVVVDNFHLFLLVFMYVHGGVLEAWSSFLPGIGVSQGQFSRLLHTAAPVVASTWAPHYYGVRGLDWMLQNAGPGDQVPELLETAKSADIVLFVDGTPLETEKSGTGWIQKLLFDWSKDKANIVRVLLVTTARGEIVEMNEATGGRITEVVVVRAMGITERLNEEARVVGKKVHLHWIVDRGFHDFTKLLGNTNWSNLQVTFDIPFFVNEPIGRGHGVRGGPKVKKRTQLNESEVNYNRAVAAARWVNEVAVGGLKHCHLFQKRLDLSVLHNISYFLIIAAGLVNYHIQIKQ